MFLGIVPWCGGGVGGGGGGGGGRVRCQNIESPQDPTGQQQEPLGMSLQEALPRTSFDDVAVVEGDDKGEVEPGRQDEGVEEGSPGREGSEEGRPGGEGGEEERPKEHDKETATSSPELVDSEEEAKKEVARLASTGKGKGTGSRGKAKTEPNKSEPSEPPKAEPKEEAKEEEEEEERLSSEEVSETAEQIAIKNLKAMVFMAEPKAEETPKEERVLMPSFKHKPKEDGPPKPKEEDPPKPKKLPKGAKKAAKSKCKTGKGMLEEVAGEGGRVVQVSLIENQCFLIHKMF